MKDAGVQEISLAELLPQIYDKHRKLAAARMRYETGGQPRFDLHFVEASRRPQPASVSHTAADGTEDPSDSPGGSAPSPFCARFGHDFGEHGSYPERGRTRSQKISPCVINKSGRKRSGQVALDAAGNDVRGDSVLAILIGEAATRKTHPNAAQLLQRGSTHWVLSPHVGANGHHNVGTHFWI